MERELFSWTSWEGDHFFLTFHNIVLIKPIGSFPVGTAFDAACIVQDRATDVCLLELYRDDEPAGKFRLHYRVGERIE